MFRSVQDFPLRYGRWWPFRVLFQFIVLCCYVSCSVSISVSCVLLFELFCLVVLPSMASNTSCFLFSFPYVCYFCPCVLIPIGPFKGMHEAIREEKGLSPEMHFFLSFFSRLRRGDSRYTTTFVKALFPQIFRP